MINQHQTFSRLVESDNDIIGMIAYTLYKQEKIAWIEAFTLRHGVNPTDEDIKNYFNILTDTDDKLGAYRQRAETIMQKTINEVVATDLELYRTEVKNDVLYEKVSSLKKNFWQEIGSNVLVSLISAVILALIGIAFWLWQAKNDPTLLNKVNNGVTQQVQKNIN